LRSWLKAGILKNNTFSSSETGVPQGGIISPTIANFVLDGLEGCVYASIERITKSNSRVRDYSSKLGISNVKRLNTHFVRYADDFVIICRSLHIAKTYIKPAIIKFLEVRGLSLSEEKSSISTIKEKSLEYLGYKFVYAES